MRISVEDLGREIEYTNHLHHQLNCAGDLPRHFQDKNGLYWAALYVRGAVHAAHSRILHYRHAHHQRAIERTLYQA